MNNTPLYFVDDGNLGIKINNSVNKAKYTKYLKECIKVAEERGGDYNAPEYNYVDISNICKVAFGFDITPVQLTQVMQATKLSRNKYKFKEDNLIDNINYTAMELQFRNMSNAEYEKINKDLHNKT
jgi:hypothetical protein